LCIIYENIFVIIEAGWLSIVNRLWAGQPMFKSLQGQWRDFFLIAIMARPALGPTQSPVQWIL